METEGNRLVQLITVVQFGWIGLAYHVVVALARHAYLHQCSTYLLHLQRPCKSLGVLLCLLTIIGTRST